MWISELAATSGLPVATVKFYLREGLLAPGEATGATRAHYDDSHARRLRLIRALTEIAGMRLDAVRAVLLAVDDDTVSFHDAMGSVHHRLTDSGELASPEALAQVDALVERRGWHLHDPNPHREALARSLDSLSGLGHAASDQALDDYAEAAGLVAARDVTSVARDDRVAGAEAAVIGTLLWEPVLVLLRRMAQEDASSRLPEESRSPRHSARKAD